MFCQSAPSSTEHPPDRAYFVLGYDCCTAAVAAKGVSYEARLISENDRHSGHYDHHSDQSPRVIPNVTRSERLSIKFTRSERLSIKLGYETRPIPERGPTRR